MNTSQKPTTPIQSRTRTAIVQAALRVLTFDRSAPLSEVAKRAEVSRSTLHRYFPERADLIAAVDEFAAQQVTEITERCRLDDGQVIDVMVRLALEYFERWDSVMWNYAETWGTTEQPEDDDIDVELSRLIAQGQKDGAIDTAIPGDWFQHAMYAVVYTAWEYERNGHPHAEAAMMVVSTMRKLLAPPADVVVPPVR